ncbi:MAG: CoA pyrophosphatase [Pseudomonadota bacterium]|nr:CoA pyrophosphatase [Pseudomonadota bacterium]
MVLTFKPDEVPVLGVDSALPAVSGHSLTAEALRRRFANPPAWRPEFEIERRIGERAPAHASVLIALVLRDEIGVLLTQRTDHLTDHPGQISFPGGRAEVDDADAAATALREAEEEIGLAQARVEILGNLPTYTTGTGFVITPVVGLVEPGLSLSPDPFEVAEIFEVPLRWLMDPANHQRHSVEVAGGRREFISIPWQGATADGEPRRYFIWGATAGMLRNLYRFFVA